MTSGAPAGAVAVIKGLQGALSFLDQQVDQMKGLFPDDDGQIAEAQQDAEDAQTLANQFLQTVSDPAQIVVIVEGGLVQAITPTRRLPGVEVVVIDYDVEGSSDPLSEVAQSADSSADWAKAVVTSYDMGDGSDLIDPPVIRDAEEGEGA